MYIYVSSSHICCTECFSPLHIAAQMGHTELVELLILSGGNFNCVTKVCLTL